MQRLSLYALPFCTLAVAIALATSLLVDAVTAAQTLRLQQMERQGLVIQLLR